MTAETKRRRAKPADGPTKSKVWLRRGASTPFRDGTRATIGFRAAA